MIRLQRKNEILRGEIEIPASKSEINRTLILSAISEKKCTLKNISVSDDANEMIEALEKCGYRIIKNLKRKIITITPKETFSQTPVKITLKNAGTVARFLPAFLLTRGNSFTIDAQNQLRKRPIVPLLKTFQQLGAEITFLKKKSVYPYKISVHKKINGGRISIPADISSQFISALTMAAPKFEKGLEINLIGKTTSRPYLQLTTELMKKFGVRIRFLKNKISIPHQNIKPTSIKISGDWSGAAYYFGMAMIGKTDITLKNLDMNSYQADTKVLSIAKRLGAKVIAKNNSIRIISNGENKKSFRLNLSDSPDLAQTMAVVAAFRNGKSVVRGIKNLRYKETDRLRTVARELNRLGILTYLSEDSWTIFGGKKIKNKMIHTYNDHRMAMSFAMMIAKVNEVKIQNEKVVSKSYPNFWNDLRRLKILNLKS